MYTSWRKEKGNYLSFIFVIFFLLLFISITFNDVLNSFAIQQQLNSGDLNKAVNYNGKVVKVKDGDTVVISLSGGDRLVTCRLYGIDAPETAKGKKGGMPYGEESVSALREMILGQNVGFNLIGQKTYNRDVCIIFKDNKNINLEMIKQGWAWAYVQYLKRPHASEYIEAEKIARSQKIGLWKQNNPMPPWEWRKLNKIQ